ncbi:MAG: hypothetical protein ACYCSX_02260 [Acidimicrobiales bacterium]
MSYGKRQRTTARRGSSAGAVRADVALPGHAQLLARPPAAIVGLAVAFSPQQLPS